MKDCSEDIDTIKSIRSISVKDGDVLCITLPENKLPPKLLQSYIEKSKESIKSLFPDKNIKVLVLLHGASLDVIRSRETK